MDYEIKKIEMEDEFKVCPVAVTKMGFIPCSKKKTGSKDGYLSALPAMMFSTSVLPSDRINTSGIHLFFHGL